MVKLLRFMFVPALALGLVLGQAQAASWSGEPGAGFTPGETFPQAVALVHQGRYVTAVPLLVRVISRDPRNADAYEYLGYSFERLGERRAARVFYRRALEIDPDHRRVNGYLGALYLEGGEVAKAEERLRALERTCVLGCAEYTILEKAITDHKAQDDDG